MSDTLATQAYNYYRELGYTPNAAAAIVGNISVESNFKTDAVGDFRNGTPTAFGLAQWRGSRLVDFKNFTGKTPAQASFTEHLAFIDHELNTKYTSARNAILNASSVEEATKEFMTRYEKPSSDPNVNHIDKRIAAAQKQIKNSVDSTIGDIIRNIPIPGLPGFDIGDAAGVGNTVQEQANNTLQTILGWIPRIVAILVGIILIGLSIAALMNKSDTIVNLVKPEGI